MEEFSVKKQIEIDWFLFFPNKKISIFIFYKRKLTLSIVPNSDIVTCLARSTAVATCVWCWNKKLQNYWIFFSILITSCDR